MVQELAFLFLLLYFTNDTTNFFKCQEQTEAAGFSQLQLQPASLQESSADSRIIPLDCSRRIFLRCNEQLCFICQHLLALLYIYHTSYMKSLMDREIVWEYKLQFLEASFKPNHIIKGNMETHNINAHYLFQTLIASAMVYSNILLSCCFFLYCHVYIVRTMLANSIIEKLAIKLLDYAHTDTHKMLLF